LQQPLLSTTIIDGQRWAEAVIAYVMSAAAVGVLGESSFCVS